MKDNVIIILESSYLGAYDSFLSFYDVLYNEIKNRYEVLIAKNILDYQNFIREYNVLFSINLGQFSFFVDEIPVYDKYKTLNYQWILDNPLRYPSVDTKSCYNRLILIDKSFNLINGYSRDDYLSLPLPFNKGDNISLKGKRKAILAPIKLKSEAYYLDKINSMPYKDKIISFVDGFNYDSSFLDEFLKFFSNEKNINEIFELANGLIRVRKRITILNAIKKYDVYILSDKPYDISLSKNIHFIEPVSYEEINNLQREFMLVLNCNPNYTECLHDRLANGVANGSLVLTDANELLISLGFPLAIKYNNLEEIDDKITEALANYEYFHKIQLNIINKYSVCETVDKIIENYRSLKAL